MRQAESSGSISQIIVHKIRGINIAIILTDLFNFSSTSITSALVIVVLSAY